MSTADGAPTGMLPVPGGTFVMGSDDFYPEERPAHPVTVSAYWLDRAPVTVGQFAAFVEGTRYVTVAEQAPDPADYPGVDTSGIGPGALVFTGSDGPVPLTDPARWWSWVEGASWRSPEGPGSDALTDRADHPVTQVAWPDAAAYAAWAGRRLPTEAELEYAAWGGRWDDVPVDPGKSGDLARERGPYAWGAERAPGGVHLANTWQGAFPYENIAADGWPRTSPVGGFPANGYGLVDLIGNVWEWTSDRWTTRHPAAAMSPCCVPRDPRRPHEGAVAARDVFVVKGGSHLCAPEYCLRYRPAARQPQERDSASSHLGFRCAWSPTR